MVGWPCEFAHIVLGSISGYWIVMKIYNKMGPNE